MRTSEIERKTSETDIKIRLNIDGKGNHEINSGIGFFDHMLNHIAVHGLFDVELKADGDLHIDPHHTIEDTAICLGKAIKEAIGDKKGIFRMGTSFVPMDEALAFVALDLSGRPYWNINIKWKGEIVAGTNGCIITTSLINHFFQTLAVNSALTVHIKVEEGEDNHHICEAVFKAFARALDKATRTDPRRTSIPSTKGVLE